MRNVTMPRRAVLLSILTLGGAVAVAGLSGFGDAAWAKGGGGGSGGGSGGSSGGGGSGSGGGHGGGGGGHGGGRGGHGGKGHGHGGHGGKGHGHGGKGHGHDGNPTPSGNPVSSVGGDPLGCRWPEIFYCR